MLKPEPRLNVPRRAALCAVVAALAFAQGPSSAAPTAHAPAKDPFDQKTPSVTVTGKRETPHVVSTFPAQGARVAPGLMVLRVTYDTHMRRDGWAYAEASPVAYPDCAKAPRLLDDKSTFVLICRTLPGKAYAVWFNRPPLVDFASLSRQPALPYELKFTTSQDEPVRTLADAVKADPALAGKGEPVQAQGLPHLDGEGDPTPE